MTLTKTILESERLLKLGLGHEAIELLTEANRVCASSDLEQRLVELRYDAFYATEQASVGEAPKTPLTDPLTSVGDGVDPFPGVHDAPPEVTQAELNVEALRGAMKHHGSLIVRGLVDPQRTQSLAAAIQRSIASASRFIDDLNATPDEWYRPFIKGGDRKGFGRIWARREGTIYAGDCPRVLFELLEAYRAAGIDRLMAEYFGERTAMSLQKCAIREIEPEQVRKTELSMWHQDGRFLGEGIQAVNVWIAFSESGARAPGLEVVPKRLETIVPTGTGDAGFETAVGREVVREVAGDSAPMTPIFQPGDAIIFDKMCLHSTFVQPEMTEKRLSSETWFIAESTYPPDTWVPLAL